MTHARTVLSALAAIAALVTAARADDGLSAERPDFTNSPTVVGRGVLQLEGGSTLARDAWSFGELLARVGVARRVELRLGAGAAGTRDVPHETSGFQDLSLGAKVALHQSASGSRWPHLALIAETTVPTGSKPLRAETWEPDANLCLGWDLSETINLGTSQILALPDNGRGGRVAEWTGSASLERSFGSLGGFVEYYATQALEASSTADHFADTGLTLAIGPNAQLDARVGTRMSGIDHPDWFVGLGGARRW